MDVAFETFLWAAVVCAVLTPIVSHLTRVGLAAHPLPDRWHHPGITPISGGIAIFAAYVIALIWAYPTPALDSAYVPLTLGAAAAFVLGLWDDLRDLSPRAKLLGQIGISLAAALAGLRPDWLSPWIGVPVAVMVLVAVMNAVNLLDNMDGLAAGTAAVAAVGLAGIAVVIAGDSPASQVAAAALAGACVGFLPFNFRRRRPAMLFMGDSGSLFLGFALGGLALLASPGGVGGVTAGVVAPLIVLSLPLLDTALVILVRRSEGRPVSAGGRDHSSHRLVYRGFGERHAVALLLAFAATCGGIAVALVAIDNVAVTLAAAVLVAVGMLMLGRRLAQIADGEVEQARPAQRLPDAAAVAGRSRPAARPASRI
jgi:UDP-GlcNAc:undecaprenyl-phosphate/decaprenyl-phosphate GlcNAc-1-phosphate transferase